MPYTDPAKHRACQQKFKSRKVQKINWCKFFKEYPQPDRRVWDGRGEKGGAKASMAVDASLLLICSDKMRGQEKLAIKKYGPFVHPQGPKNEFGLPPKYARTNKEEALFHKLRTERYARYYQEKMAGLSQEGHEDRRASRRKDYSERREHYLNHQKEWRYGKGKEKYETFLKKYRGENQTKINEQQKERRKKLDPVESARMAKLYKDKPTAQWRHSDNYMIRLIIGRPKTRVINKEDVPQDLIDLKRLQVTMKRKLEDHKKEAHNGREKKITC